MNIKKLDFSVLVLLMTVCFVAVSCDRSSDDIPPQKRTTAEADPVVPETVGTSTAEHAPGASEWCAGHGLPESKCTKCNPGLTEGFKESGDWCTEHEFPESACPVCNPMTPPTRNDEARAGSPDDWCNGHGLPESMCTRCNPELTANFKESGDWCAAHELPESVCPICNPMTAPGHGGTP